MRAVVIRSEVKGGMRAKVGFGELLDRLASVQTPQIDGLIRGADELVAADKLQREDPTRVASERLQAHIFVHIPHFYGLVGRTARHYRAVDNLESVDVIGVSA